MIRIKNTTQFKELKKEIMDELKRFNCTRSIKEINIRKTCSMYSGCYRPESWNGNRTGNIIIRISSNEARYVQFPYRRNHKHGIDIELNNWLEIGMFIFFHEMSHHIDHKYNLKIRSKSRRVEKRADKNAAKWLERWRREKYV